MLTRHPAHPTYPRMHVLELFTRAGRATSCALVVSAIRVCAIPSREGHGGSCTHEPVSLQHYDRCLTLCDCMVEPRLHLHDLLFVFAPTDIIFMHAALRGLWMFLSACTYATGRKRLGALLEARVRLMSTMFLARAHVRLTSARGFGVPPSLCDWFWSSITTNGISSPP